MRDPTPTPFDLRLLGPPVLRVHGTPVAVPTQKALAVACVLAARRAPVSRAELAELLWGPGRTQSVRQALYTLRRQAGLGDCLGEGDPVTLSATSDLARFEDALAAGDPAAALDAWAGGFLVGFEVRGAPAFAEWVAETRTRLEARYLDALRRRLEGLETEGRIEDARTVAGRLLAADPIDEAAHRAAIRLAYLDGDREGALFAYQACRHALARELGVEPDAETEALVRDLARGLSGTPALRRIPLPVLRPPVLAGRGAEWARLEAAWVARRPVLLVGPGGSGKSRLAGDFARDRGAVLAGGGRPGDRAVPYLAVARLLRTLLDGGDDPAVEPWIAAELARVLPDRFGDAPADRPDPAARARFVAACVEVLARAGDTVDTVILDDLHLLDVPSFELACRLLAGGLGADGPRLVACTREAELSGAGWEALAAPVREGAVERVDLPPLGEAGIAHLLEGIGIDGLAPLAPELFRLSGGIPLQVVEILKDLAASGDLDAEAPRIPPRGAAATVARRLVSVSSMARRVARALSLSEAPLGIDALARVTGADPFEIAGALDELEALAILEGGAFAHDLVRRAVEDDVPPGTARLLHGRLAAALEGAGASPAAVAGHLLAAGDRAAAAPHLLAAGRAAASRFADEEARRLLGEALAATGDSRLHLEAWLVLEAVAARTGEGRDEALDALDRLAAELQDDLAFYEAKRRRSEHLVQGGRPAEAATLGEAALAIARRLGDPVRAGRAQMALGLARLRTGDLAGARAAFADAAGAPDDALRIAGLNGVGAIDGIRGDLEPAFARHQEALTLARARGDVTAAGRLLNSLAATAERLAWYREAASFFEEAVTLARRTRDPRSEAVASFNAAEIDIRLGRFAAALERLASGEAVAEGLGLPGVVALGRVRRGTLERAVGRPARAAGCLAEALAAYRAAGDTGNAAVIAFNVEIARAEAGELPALARARAAVEAIEARGIRDIAAWAWLELALVTPDPGDARRFAAKGPAAKDNPHVRLLAALARQRAALLEDPSAPPDPALAGLATKVEVFESAWAEALLARASAISDGSRHRRAARARVAAAAEGLDEAMTQALEARLAGWLGDRAAPLTAASGADV